MSIKRIDKEIMREKLREAWAKVVVTDDMSPEQREVVEMLQRGTPVLVELAVWQADEILRNQDDPMAGIGKIGTVLANVLSNACESLTLPPGETLKPGEMEPSHMAIHTLIEALSDQLHVIHHELSGDGDGHLVEVGAFDVPIIDKGDA